MLLSLIPNILALRSPRLNSFVMFSLIAFRPKVSTSCFTVVMWCVTSPLPLELHIIPIFT